MAVDAEARQEAARAHKAVNDAFGQIGGIAADVAATRREVLAVKRLTAWLIPLAVAAIGAITQIQVARIEAIKPKQDEAAAWLQRQRDADAIEARLASRLDGIQTEVERLRRNAPAPLPSAPDRVKVQ